MQAATLVPSLLKINPHSVWRRQAVDLEPPDPSAFDIHEICLGTAVDDAAIYPASMASCGLAGPLRNPPRSLMEDTVSLTGHLTL